MKQYIDYMVEQMKNLMAIDSPTGFTDYACDYVLEELKGMGYDPIRTRKGGVVVFLGGDLEQEGLLLTAHMDTLGAMVAEIKPNGRLRVKPVGGLPVHNVQGEVCRVYTNCGKIYEGTCQLCNASFHVNADYETTKRTYDTVEIVLDEDTSSLQETIDLGIEHGDFVCFEPRFRITESGYIKSRFLDDKLSVGILLGYAKYLKEEGKELSQPVYIHFTAFEEVGHGASASTPDNIGTVISVDMGCVGDGLACTEKMVSICAMDRGGPYNRELRKKMILAAKRESIDYAVDIYPFYFSDVQGALESGHDIYHGLIGPGVYASHGYERSHIDGMVQTFKLLTAFIE